MNWIDIIIITIVAYFLFGTVRLYVKNVEKIYEIPLKLFSVDLVMKLIKKI